MVNVTITSSAVYLFQLGMNKGGYFAPFKMTEVDFSLWSYLNKELYSFKITFINILSFYSPTSRHCCFLIVEVGKPHLKSNEFSFLQSHTKEQKLGLFYFG